MTVKELKEKINALPKTLDDAKVYSYVNIGEDADDIYGVKVYDEDTFEDNEGTPYCKGDAPWNLGTNEAGHLIVKIWEGSPAFVVIG